MVTKLADERTTIVPTGCPVCGRQAGGEAVHSTSYHQSLLHFWAVVPVCDECAERLRRGEVDVDRLARKARVLLAGYGFSEN
jgi:ribosome-binding protein aMBF1 (putative translation factor)